MYNTTNHNHKCPWCHGSGHIINELVTRYNDTTTCPYCDGTGIASHQYDGR
jgi:DnaJ-class molecular chaperone